jgi:FkbM family methyltransferase
MNLYISWQRVVVLKNKNVLTNSDYGLMLINRNDTIIGHSISYSGGWENQYIQLLKGLIKKFYIPNTPIEVIDGGANLGTYSLALSKIEGHSVKIYAFEAQRLIFQMLNANVALNSLENVWTYHKVLSDRDGDWVPIECPDLNFPANFGAFEIPGTVRNSDYDGKKFMGVEHVESMKLDSLELSHCALIKLDIEGMENEVLKGGSNLIQTSKPILFFERHKTDYEQVKNFLSNLNYSIWELPQQNTLALRNEWDVTIPNVTRIQL